MIKEAADQEVYAYRKIGGQRTWEKYDAQNIFYSITWDRGRVDPFTWIKMDGQNRIIGSGREKNFRAAAIKAAAAR